MDHIQFTDFQQVDMRTGTILEAALNPKARKPAYVMQIDFGDLGIKISSAQLTQNYEADDLIGRQVVAVVNFPPMHIAGVKSEVLVLAAVSEAAGPVLLKPDQPVGNGEAIG